MVLTYMRLCANFKKSQVIKGGTGRQGTRAQGKRRLKSAGGGMRNRETEVTWGFLIPEPQ